jgi:serine/threonine protein kinase
VPDGTSGNERSAGHENRLIADRYLLLDRLGTGAMGVVWRAEDQRLRRVVAVKELLLQNSPGAGQTAAEASARAMREGRIAARLLHPHAIAVFDVVQDGEHPCLIMEYLPSTSLSDLLARAERLPPAVVAIIGSQIASALAAAHQRGIVHRDVKPANVLLAEDGSAKITDFGISRAAGDVTLTATGIVAGTPAYFAPEVARGDDADVRSDVFSLGATLYHALEGSPPFGFADNTIALLHRVAQGKFEPPRHAGPLTPVLLRMLDEDPDARPTMTEAAETLRSAAAPGGPPAGSPVPEPPSSPMEHTPARPRRRRRGVLIATAAVIALLAGGLTAVWFASSDDPGGTATPDPTVSSDAGAPTESTASGTPQPPTQSSTEDSTSPTPVPRAEALENAVTDYYALLPGDLDTAYSLLTEQFKAARTPSFADYEAFWNQMRAVDVSEVTARGETSVAATISYSYKDGRTMNERHVYTLVEQDGRWLIASQSQA